MKKLMTGNDAAALAARLANPQVIAAYPITPQTSIAEKLAAYAAGGKMHTRYIKVESETSALAACIGGSLSGARVFTATSSQGLALMHELLHWSAGARLPIVLVNVNRSMAAPWSLGVDHNDSLSQRDTGCLQIYCETAQEVLDTVLIAFKLAEAVLLPIMVCMDGFLLSHYSEPVEIPDPKEVNRFLPPRRARYKLDPRQPCTLGGGVNSQVLFQLRQQMQEDIQDFTPEFDVIYISAGSERTIQRLLKKATHDMQKDRVSLPAGAKRKQTVMLSRVRGSDARVLYRELSPAAIAADPGKKDAELSKSIVREIAAGKFAAMVIDISYQNAPLESIRQFASGRLGALSMESYQQRRRSNSIQRTEHMVRFSDLNTASFQKSIRIPPSQPAGLYSKRQAVRSARRCFKCGICTFCKKCYDYCPDLSIHMDPKQKYREVDYDHCKGCGICAAECPRAAIDWVKD